MYEYQGVGADIILRAPEPEDLSFLYALENDPHVWDISTLLGPISRATLENMVGAMPLIPTETQFRYLPCRAGDATPLGVVDFFSVHWLHRRAELGLIVYPSDLQGKGWGKKILSTVELFAYRRMHLRQLYLEIQASNLASQKLFLSAGYRLIGVKEQWLRSTDGGYADVMCFQKRLGDGR